MRLEPFIPHSYQHLLDARVFVPPLPDKFYDGLCAEYNELDLNTHRITYQSDGLNVTGILCTPKDIRPSGHPIIIYNRGGNREYGKLTVLSVIRSMAPFAKEGHLVFASNYRGNDGGEGRDEFGGNDVHDVLNLLQQAKQHEGWDGKNIFMIGHSRGGMMTYLSIKHGAKLNAAISIAGAADMFTAAEERPELETRVYQQLISGDRQKEYLERSAVCWPEKLTVPLLLLHGDADDKVDVSESIRLAEKLSHKHELVIYPGGNHALVRHWNAVLERCLSWLQEHRL